MTIDERLDGLAERHEALTQSVELMVAENREAALKAERIAAEMAAENRQRDRRLGEIMEGIASLLHVAEIHEHRLELCRRELALIKTEDASYEEVAAAAWLGEVALARKWAQTARALRGPVRAIALLAEGRTAEALKVFEDVPMRYGPGANWEYLWWRMAYASALEQQGRISEAIAQFGEETRPANVDFYWGTMWPRARLKLAELLRKAHRPAEATKVEDEIRHYLSEADSDYWVLARLRAIQARAGN